jgi:multidrug efflux pump subunit AcrA (membrane-fusion protein)
VPLAGGIPPWLAVNPRDFTSAAEAGARLGLESKSEADQQTQENANRQQQAIESNASLGQRAAESAGQQQLEAERLAAQQAEAQQRLQLETQAAARKFQAQQGYAQAVQQGVDPIHAMMQFGPLMGESLAGLGPLSLSQTRMKQAAIPPAAIPGPDGKPVGYTYDGQMHMLPAPKAQANVPQKMSDADKMMAAHLISELKDVNKEETDNAILPDAATARSLRNRRDQAEQKLKKLGVDIGDGESPDAAADEKPADQSKTAQGGYKIGATYKGGLKYLGGDPNDQSSWQQANTATQ